MLQVFYRVLCSNAEPYYRVTTMIVSYFFFSANGKFIIPSETAIFYSELFLRFLGFVEEPGESGLGDGDGISFLGDFS